jgi:hypothetical protein
MAHALAVMFDSVTATAPKSACLSDSRAWEVTTTRAPQRPMRKAAGIVPHGLGTETRIRAPAPMADAPPHRETSLPHRADSLSPKRPSRTAPAAKALKCRLAVV